LSAAHDLARWRAPDGDRATMADVSAACRALATPRLGALARRVKPRQTWDDLVLPPEQVAQLRELCNQARHRHVVLSEWGFERKLPLGRGLNVLFAGPPGTGKTVAAQVLANELARELYQVDLSQIVSKYIGETEKNLRQVFDEADACHAILFFDEADALFGKRSEVSDAHDRYANIEISYLLQKLETYQGLAVLTTNMLENLDEAFIRRLAFKVHFPFPEVGERRAIWERIWPAATPLGDDVDLDALAVGFRLSGGNIKNVALSAAFHAAGEGSAVSMRHVLHGVRRELAKEGKAPPADEPTTPAVGPSVAGLKT
jgi:SpoVK/Ycf46/Vps4 family AAA+-type ATPase